MGRNSLLTMDENELDLCPDCEENYLELKQDDFDYEYYLTCPRCHNRIWVTESYFDDEDDDE